MKKMPWMRNQLFLFPVHLHQMKAVFAVLVKESVEIESVLEADILCNHVSKRPRDKQPIFDSYDDDKISLPGLDLERQPMFDNEE